MENETRASLLTKKLLLSKGSVPCSFVFGMENNSLNFRKYSKITSSIQNEPSNCNIRPRLRDEWQRR